MPYQKIEELPSSIKGNLPTHAQEIYKEAFNHAWEEYKNPEDRRNGASREEIAHRVAWSAVKKEYEKIDGQWRKK